MIKQHRHRPALVLKTGGKWLIILVCGLISTTNSYTQVGISTTTITPDASSVLELRSTTTGFLPPRMTTTQRDAIASPATGLLVYNTTTSQLNYYTGSAWQIVSVGSWGTVTSASVATANGFAGTVTNATTTPAITVSTSVNGIAKGNGTALTAATAGTDYSAGTSSLGTGILKSTTSSGALSIAVAADFPTLNQNTTGTAASFTGSLAGDVTGTQSATTVGKINGTALSGLATGILKNTTTTGVPSIAVAADFPTLNQNTTGTAASFTGSLAGDVTGTQSATTVGKINGTSLAGLSTGILKNTTSTGVPTIATVRTDYAEPTTGLATGLLKNTTTTGAHTIAVAGIDYGRVDSIRFVNSGILHTTPAAFSLSGNTAIVTQSLNSQNSNTFLAAPNGSSGTPTFRSIVAADIPILNQNTTGNAATVTTNANLTGDLTSVGNATTLATVNSNIGTFNSVTVNAKGLVTAASTTPTTGTGNVVLATSPTLITPVLGAASATSLAITGTGGNGFVSLTTQSSNPAAPTSGTVLFSNSNSKLSWRGSANTFVKTFDGAAATADRIYTLPDAAGTIPVSASGNIALSTIGDISFTGTLPIANGGTNSSTALNNNRVMISSGGKIVEGTALTNGQLNIGLTGAAPVPANITAGNGITITNGAGSIQIDNTPTITQATATADVTTTSTTDVLLTGMTITPGAGDYLVFFTGSCENSNALKQGTVSIYSNGVQIAASVNQAQAAASYAFTVATNAYITGLAAGQAIDVRWKVVANTGTFHQRTLIVQKVK